MLLAALIFLMTYTGIALGHIPGLAVDRTGIALLGAILMIAVGVISPEQAVDSIDIPTLLLLYALMVVSAQLRLSGFYTWTALKILPLLAYPRVFLLVLMLLSGVLSAVLANDIVCLAFTPVLCVSVLQAGLNPIPFLLGLAVASNIGSAMTIIGNPQNMLIGQVANLDFKSFLLYCSLPSIVSLLVSFYIIYLRYRKKFNLPPMTTFPDKKYWPNFDTEQTAKGLLGVVLLLGLFFTSLKREVSALVIAGILLCSRKMRTRAVLGLVDWHLITLFCALFIVIRGIESTEFPSAVLHSMTNMGFNINNFYVVTGLSVCLSNLVSNVPAVMLLTKILNPIQVEGWYILALSSTFAGNLLIIGSIANLITIEQAKEFGIEITLWEHARTGIPVTLVSIGVLFAWIAILA